MHLQGRMLANYVCLNWPDLQVYSTQPVSSEPLSCTTEESTKLPCPLALFLEH